MAFICTTNDREFAPSQIRSPWDSLSSSLRKELGAEFELFLAKPLPHDGKTDWYIDEDAQPIRLSALGSAQKAAVLARLDGMRRQVIAYADRLEAPNSRNRSPGMAADLRAAMRVPAGDDSQYVWTVNGQPVLVAWGLEPFSLARGEGPAVGVGEIRLPTDTRDLRPEGLDGPSVPPQAPVAPALQPNILARFPWALPLWLLFVVLVGASYFLLLQGCAFSPSGAGAWLAPILPNSCSASAAPLGLITERERRDNLIARIRSAELDAARLKSSCSAGPSKQPQQENQKRACNEVQKRLQENQAQIGAMEVMLQWNGLEDLDLWVTCPGGHASANSNNNGVCESTGDIDWNYQGHINDHPVEHIVWKQSPPVGHYRVEVRYFDPKGPDHPVQFDVFVKRNGVVEGPFHGVVQTKSEEVYPYSFEVGPRDASVKPPTAPSPQSPQCDAG